MTHGPEGCVQGGNQDEWPELPNGVLRIGNVDYSADDLCQAFQRTPGHNNCLPSLAHQLIGAKLNILNGADDSCIKETIAEADALIGNLNILTDSLSCNLVQYVTELTDYNEGKKCVAHCGEETPQAPREPNGCEIITPTPTPVDTN
jgi:hypothetical protein